MERRHPVAKYLRAGPHAQQAYTDYERDRFRLFPEETDNVYGTEFSGANNNIYYDNERRDPAIADPRHRLRTYRQMRDEETTISSMLFLINRMLLAVEWEVQGDRADWVEDQFKKNMRRSFPSFISEAQSFLMYGFSLFEKVFQKLPDGTVGLWDLSPRIQSSIAHWNVETVPYTKYDSILSVEQDVTLFNYERIQFINKDTNPLERKVTIPYAKLVHFKNYSADSHPEGLSILRPCYRTWRMLRDIEKAEIMAADRDLNGLPVISMPNRMLTATDAKTREIVERYKQLATGIRVNDQTGVLLPSDPWRNQDGTYANERLVELKLMSSGGTRLINTDQVIRRLQASIARTILADFLVLGSGTGAGSYNLGQDKSDIFLTAITGWLSYIADVLNASVIPDFWAINGWSGEPARLVPGNVQKVDVLKTAQAINYLAQSGMPIFPTEDDSLELKLFDLLDLPGAGRAEKLPLNIHDPASNKQPAPAGGK